MYREFSCKRGPLHGFFVLPRWRVLFFALAAILSGSALAQLPGGWSDADIGNPGLAGSASYSGGTWSVAGGGSDIWGASDQFHFAYQTTTNNVIVARVDSIQNTDGWAKSGVMFRDSIDPASVFASVVITSGQRRQFPMAEHLWWPVQLCSGGRRLRSDLGETGATEQRFCGLLRFRRSELDADRRVADDPDDRQPPGGFVRNGTQQLGAEYVNFHGSRLDLSGSHPSTSAADVWRVSGTVDGNLRRNGCADKPGGEPELAGQPEPGSYDQLHEL